MQFIFLVHLLINSGIEIVQSRSNCLFGNKKKRKRLVAN